MKATVLLNYNDNLKKAEEEEKSHFLRGLLEQFFENTDVINQVQEIWGPDNYLSVEQKIKMRELLTTYGIQIIDDLDGNMKIYVDGELVAEWYKCNYKLKKDLLQIDHKKRFYLEMEISCWSVFELQTE